MAAGEVLAGCDHRVPDPTRGTKKKGEFNMELGGGIPALVVS